MKKKLLSTLLTLTMTVSLFAGCSSGSDGKADGSTTQSGGTDGEVQEITWMFWDDLNATEDLISKGYADVIER